MAQSRSRKDDLSLKTHLLAVKQGKRCFENAFQGVARMILTQPISKVVVYSSLPKVYLEWPVTWVT